MEIISPQVIIAAPISATKVYTNLELYGRTAYKSEAAITVGSAEKFLRNIIKSGHESVLEHENITVRFICDRGVTHELVRHRLAAYTQESTRYVNYAKRGMQVVKPCFWDDDMQEGGAPTESSYKYRLWKAAMANAERSYNLLISRGATPQEARSVLPNSLKTEIVATMNIRQWRHVLAQRTSKAAHPQMREIMCKLLDELKQALPVLFEDIQYT